MKALFEACCDKCTHSNQNPCRDFILCRTGGPLCHDDEQCREKRQAVLNHLLDVDNDEPVIYVGMGTCGLAAGAGEVYEALEQKLYEAGIKARLKKVGCMGLCSEEPVVDIKRPGSPRVCFAQVKPKDVPDLIAYVAEGKLPARSPLGTVSPRGIKPAIGLLPSFIDFDIAGEDNGEDNHVAENEISRIPPLDSLPVFEKQTRIVLANCGLIDPESLEEYVARGGYMALSKALKEMSPETVIDQVKASGLRGRGGGGFPTGRKWELTAQSDQHPKYIVCNADEGDPGAFMDRSVLEGDPHRVLEGILIAGYAIGAEEAIVYVRAEYPLAILRLEKAIADLRRVGLLGSNILGSGFSFDIRIKRGAGAFVCGEETALLASIEGKRGMPRPRPPFPAQSGLWGKPTCINNVETFANVSAIILAGADRYSSIGTASSKGTKVFALTGKVRNTGLIEVPMGIALRQIVFDVGGGIASGLGFKAVQIGGPSGGCLPAELLDTPIDYDSLLAVGAMMGSGGLVVMDEKTCMVDVARFFTSFTTKESCGKCIPCREGNARLLEILDRIITARSEETPEDTLKRFKSVTELSTLAQVIKETSACGLGQTAPNPVLSTLRYFRDEYEAHVYERRCPAGHCKSLLTYTIDPEQCTGCGVCARKCPQGAIVGEIKHAHYIVTDKCARCGVCVEFCNFDAILAN